MQIYQNQLGNVTLVTYLYRFATLARLGKQYFGLAQNWPFFLVLLKQLLRTRGLVRSVRWFCVCIHTLAHRVKYQSVSWPLHMLCPLWNLTWAGFNHAFSVWWLGTSEGGWEEDRSNDDRRQHHSPKMAFFLHDAVGSLEKRTQPRDPSLYPSSAFVCLPLSPFMSCCLSRYLIYVPLYFSSSPCKNLWRSIIYF